MQSAGLNAVSWFKLFPISHKRSIWESRGATHIVRVQAEEVALPGQEASSRALEQLSWDLGGGKEVQAPGGSLLNSDQDSRERAGIGLV